MLSEFPVDFRIEVYKTKTFFYRKQDTRDDPEGYETLMTYLLQTVNFTKLKFYLGTGFSSMN